MLVGTKRIVQTIYLGGTAGTVSRPICGREILFFLTTKDYEGTRRKEPKAFVTLCVLCGERGVLCQIN